MQFAIRGEQTDNRIQIRVDDSGIGFLYRNFEQHARGPGSDWS